MSKKIVNVKIVNMIKRAQIYGNTRYKFVCYLLAKLGYSNHSLHKLEVRNKVYNYIKKKYSRGVLQCNYVNENEFHSTQDIWICWLQGLENAPEIVKKCIASVQYWCSGKDIHIIDINNLFEYVEISPVILRKWKQGYISSTLFSDFLRLELLIKYGGIWIDATVFMTGYLPDYIESEKFFMYRTSKDDEAKIGESWLIKSPKNYRLLIVTRDLLLRYWESETKIREYFIMFICMKIASERYPEDVQDIYIPNSIPLMLQQQLENDFNEDVWETILKITPIHKLTYKVEKKSMENETYFQHIVKMNYPEVS